MDSAPVFEIKKFDMKKIKRDGIIVFIGKRRTGKSTLVKDFFYHNNDFPAGMIISGSEKLNEFFGDFVPKQFIYYEFKQELLQKALKGQEKIVEYNKKPENRRKINPDFYLVMDDCFHDNSWQKLKEMREIFFNGRHFKICFLLTMQFPIGIPNYFRANIDYVFILRDTSINNMERIYKNYSRSSLSFKEFCQLMEQCTEDHGCLVIDNTTHSNKIEDQIFWYKAEIHNDPFLVH
jgi:hypothetical protein